MQSRRRASGYQLIELLIALAISALVLALGVPPLLAARREAPGRARGGRGRLHLSRRARLRHPPRRQRRTEVPTSPTTARSPGRSTATATATAFAPSTSTPATTREVSRRRRRLAHLGRGRSASASHPAGRRAIPATPAAGSTGSTTRSASIAPTSPRSTRSGPRLPARSTSPTARAISPRRASSAAPAKSAVLAYDVATRALATEPRRDPVCDRMLTCNGT